MKMFMAALRRPQSLTPVLNSLKAWTTLLSTFASSNKKLSFQMNTPTFFLKCLVLLILFRATEAAIESFAMHAKF